MVRFLRKILGIKKRYAFISGLDTLYYWDYSDEDAYSQLQEDRPFDYTRFEFLG